MEAIATLLLTVKGYYTKYYLGLFDLWIQKEIWASVVVAATQRVNKHASDTFSFKSFRSSFSPDPRSWYTYSFELELFEEGMEDL